MAFLLLLHKALGAVTLLSLAKHRDLECDHNFFPESFVPYQNEEEPEDCTMELWSFVI